MKPDNQNTGMQTRARSEQEASGGQDDTPPRTTTSRTTSTTTTTTSSTERPASSISLTLPTISTVRATPTVTTNNPPRVTVHLTPYDGASSAVQWWLNFMSYVSLYQMTDSQALHIIPFNVTEPVKHWFYQLALASKSSLSAFKHAFFDRFRKTDEDLDLDDIKQGANEKLDSYLFRLQQAAADLTIPEPDLVKKAIKGLHQSIRGHVYMRKPKTMEELRTEAKLVDRGLNMSQPANVDITATINASVNAAMASMSQMMLETHVAAYNQTPIQKLNG